MLLNAITMQLDTWSNQTHGEGKSRKVYSILSVNYSQSESCFLLTGSCCCILGFVRTYINACPRGPWYTVNIDFGC